MIFLNSFPKPTPLCPLHGQNEEPSLETHWPLPCNCDAGSLQLCILKWPLNALPPTGLHLCVLIEITLLKCERMRSPETVDVSWAVLWCIGVTSSIHPPPCEQTNALVLVIGIGVVVHSHRPSLMLTHSKPEGIRTPSSLVAKPRKRLTAASTPPSAK